MASRQEGGAPSDRSRAHNPSEVSRSRVSPPFNTSHHSASYRTLQEHQNDWVSSLQEQPAEREQHISRLQDALRFERDKGAQLQYRCNQQVAELKRQEQQMNRMREKLSQLSDRNKDRGMSFEIVNVLPKPSGWREAATRGTKPDARKEEALRLMLDRREAELREAMKLRHSLTTLLHALRTDMQQTLEEETDLMGASGLIQSEQTLGDHVTGGVVLEWVRVQTRLKELLVQDPSAVQTDHEKLLVQYEEELEQSRDLIRVQQRLLQDGAASSLSDALVDSYHLEEWERLQEQRAELEHQRRNFQRERQAFTDAAIRLGRERCEFEQQKASLMKQWFLSTSPASETSQCNKTDRRTQPRPVSPSSSSEGSEVTVWSEQWTPRTPELRCDLQLTDYYGNAGGLEVGDWTTGDARMTKPAADSWPF